MTIEQFMQKVLELRIPLNWEIKLSLPNEYFDLKGIHVIDQNEIGLVFEDHQRITSLNEDPEEYEIPTV